MARTFCFKCRNCQARWESPTVDSTLHPDNDCRNPDVVRDYRGERAYMHMALGERDPG